MEQSNNINIKFEQESSEQEKENNISIVNKIVDLQSYFSKLKINNKKYIDIISFSSDYINNIYEFLSNIVDDSITVKYSTIFYLAYIALVGFRFSYSNNLGDNELFRFQINSYPKFLEFLFHYSILNMLKTDYENYSIFIQNEYKNDNDLYLNLIIGIDLEKSFSPKLIEEKNKRKIEEINKNREKKENLELFSGKDLNKKKDNSENSNNKNKNGNSKENNLIIINGEVKKNLYLIELNNNDTKKMNQRFENSINHTDDKINELQKHNNMNEADILNIYEKMQKMESSLIIRSDFKIININFKMIETNEDLKYEHFINSAYINIWLKKMEYLETYNKSLQNIIINLSNPYNFNFWRKIANIILKNIFIVLERKKYKIIQNKNLSIFSELEKQGSKVSKKNKKKFEEKLRDYKQKLDSTNSITTENDFKTVDKDRKFNLITIYKNGQPDIPDIEASLSIDFLFFLKEQGNKINHFDEKLLNIILFNDLVTTENNEIIRKRLKFEIQKKNNVKEDSVENNSISSDMIKINLNKEEKIISEKSKEKRVKENDINKIEEIKVTKEVIFNDLLCVKDEPTQESEKNQRE